MHMQAPRIRIAYVYEMIKYAENMTALKARVISV